MLLWWCAYTEVYDGRVACLRRYGFAMFGKLPAAMLSAYRAISRRYDGEAWTSETASEALDYVALSLTYPQLFLEDRPSMYYLCGLERSSSRDHAGEYLGVHIQWLQKVVDGDCPTVTDKRQFAAICAENGLPCSPPIVSFERGRMVWYQPTKQLPARDLFSLAGTAECGIDAKRWFYRDGRYEGEDGVALGRDQLLEQLRRVSEDRIQIVRARLVNHPSLEAIAPNVLSTIRVYTCKRVGRPPLVYSALIKFAVGDVPADNMAQGAIGATIDLQRGVTLAAMDLRGRPFEAHPISGTPLVGVAIPFWQEVVDLCIRAHNIFDSFRIHGWDIAVTDAGPVFIEGNLIANITGAQLGGFVRLACTEFPDALLESLPALRSSGLSRLWAVETE